MVQKYGVLRRKKNIIGSGNGFLETTDKSINKRHNPKTM
jgi:hypothetical protein